jgi:polyribonucleotide nucleotidyltransferase
VRSRILAASRASTVATRAPCVRSPSAPACCRVPTVRRCSPAAKPRRWSSPRWAPAATSRSSTRSRRVPRALHAHYNFPPYATGECGRCRYAQASRDRSRRLAKRAMIAVLPKRKSSPTRCASSPRSPNPTARRWPRVRRLPGADGCRRAAEGARGRYRHGPDQGRQPFCRADRHPGRRRSPRRHGLQGGRYRYGVTALQMDIKIQGITKEIMQVALAQAKEGRCTSSARCRRPWRRRVEEVSTYAPRIYTMKINPEKIRDVIGKGGAVIRAITEETGTTIDIKDDGTITIASVDGEAAKRPRRASKRSPPRSKSARSTKARCSSCSISVPSSASCRAVTAAAHLADRQRARQCRVRLPQGRPESARQGARSRREGRVRLSMKALREEAAAAHLLHRLKVSRKRNQSSQQQKRTLRRPFLLVQAGWSK